MISKRNQNMMLLSGALVALLSFASVTEHETLAMCGCVSQASIDTSLPLSHPQNRCAINKENGVSWSSWFIGAKSQQFHYLDLLELLTRNSDQDSDTVNASAG
ncbi:MAG: hypothetical protein GJ680_13660 [Alteromonadaceae bacterium]|nr:hypothetical protein [Alteromonadaceae bacterium]